MVGQTFMDILCAISTPCCVDETFRQITGDGSCFNYRSIYPNNAEGKKKCALSYGGRYGRHYSDKLFCFGPSSCWWTPGARTSGWPSNLAVHIKSSLDLCSYGRAGAVALYLKSDDLWLQPSCLADLITRPAFGTWSWDFPQWEGERDRTSGCQDNWQRHLDHTVGMTEWHSLPLIVFPPSLCHSLLFSFSPSCSPTRSLFFFHLVCVFALISPPTVTPRVPIQCLPGVVILGTWEIKSLLMTDDHRFMQRWAAICNDTDMLCAFYAVLKAVSVQPCQVTGWISSNIMKYIVKVLVNKANVLPSSGHTVDLEIAWKKILKMNKWEFHRPLAEDYLTEIWVPLSFLESCLWFCSEWSR